MTVQDSVVVTQIYAKDVKLTAKKNSGNRRDKQNSVSKIITEMPLTFVFIYRENEIVARGIGEYLITVKMFLTLCQGQTVKNREHNIIKVDVSSINCTYLCRG